ncbi:hypothetical protein HAX54_038618, partial [Datura stramonium]|nr:hypothetical protein [Datura stramonium]
INLKEGRSSGQASFTRILAALCARASCSLFRPLDKTMWAEGVIALGLKTSKDAPALKRPKGMENMFQPTHTCSHSTARWQFSSCGHAPPPIGLFNIAQMAQA